MCLGAGVQLWFMSRILGPLSPERWHQASKSAQPQCKVHTSRKISFGLCSLWCVTLIAHTVAVKMMQGQTMTWVLWIIISCYLGYVVFILMAYSREADRKWRRGRELTCYNLRCHGYVIHDTPNSIFFYKLTLIYTHRHTAVEMTGDRSKTHTVQQHNRNIVWSAAVLSTYPS